MLSFRDFVPHRQSGGLFSMIEVEPLQNVLARVNDWLSSTHVKVVNVETLVVDLLRPPGSGTTMDTQEDFLTAPGASQMQIVRVWVWSERAPAASTGATVRLRQP